MNWQIPRLAPGDDFPPASQALPSLSPFPGLLAAGGRLDADTLLVAGTEPLLIEASKFGLSESVEKLRAIAGLPSISEAVPVVFVVTFTQTAND